MGSLLILQKCSLELCAHVFRKQLESVSRALQILIRVRGVKQLNNVVIPLLTVKMIQKLNSLLVQTKRNATKLRQANVIPNIKPTTKVRRKNLTRNVHLSVIQNVYVLKTKVKNIT